MTEKRKDPAIYKRKGHMRFYKISITLMFLSLWISCSPERKQASGEKAAPSRSIDQQSFEGVYRAAKAIDASIAVGINYIKFQELLQSLATEFSIASDRVKTQDEKDLLERYAEVLSMYRDSAVLLSHKIKHSGETGYEGTVFVDSELTAIVTKYELATKRITSGDPLGRTDIILIDDSIQVVWGSAHDQLEKANALLHRK